MFNYAGRIKVSIQKIFTKSQDVCGIM